MILADAINLVLAEYPGMKAIGAAESADAWIIGLDFASSTDDHPVPGTPSVAVEKTYQAFCMTLFRGRKISGIT